MGRKERWVKVEGVKGGREEEKKGEKEVEYVGKDLWDVKEYWEREREGKGVGKMKGV